MTTMIAEFFGVPKEAVRHGKLKTLSGVAFKLYVVLWHESERNLTREFTRTTRYLMDLVGGSRNSHAKARAELVRAGLAQVEPFGLDGFVFHLCDPNTGKPWPFHPKERIPYRRKGTPSATPVQPGNQPRKSSKSEIAGTSFDFGWNTAKNNPIGQPRIELSVDLNWNDIGAPIASHVQKVSTPMRKN